MLSAVSNVSSAVPSADACKTSSDLMISSWNLLMEPDILVQPCRGDTAVDSRKTQGKAIADFRVESTSGSEALLASAENRKAGRKAGRKASSNVGGQSALTASCSSDRLDAEQGKYDTGDKISRPTRLSKSKKPKAINSVAPPCEDQICNTDFKMKGDLARHTKTHDIKRSFQCEACGREFSRSDSLKRHTKIHTGEHPFPCGECEKTFTQKYHLKEHEMIHTGERHFPCDECKCRFISMDRLEKHKRIHTGERPFPCDVCEKTFIQKDHLIAHKRIHTGERPFECKECHLTFSQKSNLNKHRLVHDGKRIFKCGECGSSFKRKCELMRHESVHSNKRPFICAICNAGFKRNSSLTKHKHTHDEKRCLYKSNKTPGKTSNKRLGKKSTNNRNSSQPEPDHNNEKSFKSSHRNASSTSTSTSTSTSNQHIKPKNHTTNSKTGLTNPGDVSTTSQLPSVSNQPSTSDIHVNKSQKQGKYGEYSEYAETVALLNEFADTYPITLEPGSFEHHDDLFLDQEMPEETFPDRQNANADCLITQLHPVVDWLSTSGIHVNKSQDQEKYEEIAEVLDYDYLQPSPPKPSWDSGYPPGNFINDDFLCQDL